MRRGIVVVSAVLLTVQLTGCEPYLFRQSDRVQVTTPATYSSVTEPLTIRWQAQDFSPPQDGSYAVFIDRDPMPPGDNLSDFGPNDRDGIYVTRSTSLHLSLLSPQPGVDPAERNHHDVTVVLLDSQGNRIGEYAGFTEFTVSNGP